MSNNMNKRILIWKKILNKKERKIVWNQRYRIQNTTLLEITFDYLHNLKLEQQGNCLSKDLTRVLSVREHDSWQTVPFSFFCSIKLGWTRRGEREEKEEVDRAHCSPISPSPSLSNPLNKFVRRRKFDERRHETRSIPSIYDRPLRRYLFVYGSTETRSIRLSRARNATRRAATVYRIYISWDDPLQSCDLIVCEILMVGMENIGTKSEEPRC